MSATFEQAVVAVACVTTFFWLKILIGNFKSAGKSRKLSPEDRAAFNIQYTPVDKKDDAPDEDVGGGSGAGINLDPSASNRAERFTNRDRWNNLTNNAKENVPYALQVFWGCIIVAYIGNDNIEWLNGVTLYTSSLYAVFRFLYMIFYLYGINSRPVPLRSLVYGLGQLVAGIAAICLVVAAITGVKK